MKRFGVLIVGMSLAVSAMGCEIEGEAVAGTLDGRAAAAVATPEVAPDETPRTEDTYTHGGCPYLEAKAARGEVGCGGGCAGDKVCGGDGDGQAGCGGGCGGKGAVGDDFGGGGCGDGAF